MLLPYIFQIYHILNKTILIHICITFCEAFFIANMPQIVFILTKLHSIFKMYIEIVSIYYTVSSSCKVPVILPP